MILLVIPIFLILLAVYAVRKTKRDCQDSDTYNK